MIGTIYAHRFDVDDGSEVSDCFTVTRYGYARHFVRLEADTETFTMLLKAGLVVMFSLGLLVCVTSIIRITYVRHFNTDFTWDLVPALNWSSVEVCVAIFIACVPAFRIVATRIFPILQTTFGLRSSHKSSQETDTLHISPLDQDYFTLKPAAKPISPRDCFPLPSPFVEEGNDLVTTMTGGLIPPGDTRIGALLFLSTGSGEGTERLTKNPAKLFDKKKTDKKTKTYNSRDSHVVTHHTTNLPACGLSTAERTGSPVLHTLWSYVLAR
ncbi:hypothetical protein N7450_005560, partial [Penicillium hetheringtonii]